MTMYADDLIIIQDSGLFLWSKVNKTLLVTLRQFSGDCSNKSRLFPY